MTAKFLGGRRVGEEGGCTPLCMKCVDVGS